MLLCQPLMVRSRKDVVVLERWLFTSELTWILSSRQTWQCKIAVAQSGHNRTSCRTSRSIETPYFSGTSIHCIRDEISTGIIMFKRDSRPRLLDFMDFMRHIIHKPADNNESQGNYQCLVLWLPINRAPTDALTERADLAKAIWWLEISCASKCQQLLPRPPSSTAS